MNREIKQIIPSQATSDGAGVKLRRSLGTGPQARLDPFLMLDEFFSDNPDDYLAGFPAHPHRGFETVTYMLDGRMQHKDHMGNSGDLGPGSVQWMSAARGVIHSEMPQQAEGRMRGFQLWVNLPAAEKMRPAQYRDIPASEIPQRDFDGGSLRLIAGRIEIDGQVLAGAVNAEAGSMSTDPLYLDVRLQPGAELSLPVESGHNAFLYLYDGELSVAGKALPRRSAGILSDTGPVLLKATDAGAGALLIAGRPIGEPVVQYGPFVMNTPQEIQQAIDDYRAGRLTEADVA